MLVFGLKSHQWDAGKCLWAAYLGKKKKKKEAALCMICIFPWYKYLKISSYHQEATELILLNVELGKRLADFPEHL